MQYTSLDTVPVQAVSHNRAIEKKVLIAAQQVPHLTNFSQASFAPGQVAPAHRHEDMWEVFFVAAGSGCMKISDQDYFLRPGVCITVQPGEQHEIRNTGSQALVLNYFGIQAEN
jgi:mannose-6-phosphate isomerase-like protein (cupin superfamily)